MSWDQLATDYFEPVCRSAFDPYFQARGFSASKSEPHSVTYRRGRCWFSIHHYVEESPRFSPMLTAGMDGGGWRTWLYRQIRSLRRGRRGRPLSFNSVGLWYVIPKDAPESAYSNWRFSSREELEAIVPRLRDEVVDRWGPPLWEDPRRFEEVLCDRYDDYLEEAERDRQPPDPRKGFAILREREEAILRNAQQAKDS